MPSLQLIPREQTGGYFQASANTIHHSAAENIKGIFPPSPYSGQVPTSKLGFPMKLPLRPHSPPALPFACVVAAPLPTNNNKRKKAPTKV